MNWRLVWIWGLTLAGPVGAANNPFGIVTRLPGSFDSTGGGYHLQLARDLVGEWGYVRQGVSTRKRNYEGVRKFLLLCRAKHLIPILVGGEVPAELSDPQRVGRPRQDPPGTYYTAATYLSQWLRGLYATGVTVPYFEVLNEVNLHWEPADYAQFLFDVGRALKGVDPRLKIVSSGFAGSGAGFIEAMLTALPEVAEVVDVWALHPYGANHPPGYTDDDTSLSGYLWTLEVLAKHRIHKPLMFTETGYELGNRADERFPAITEEIRAAYMVEAYWAHWLRDPRILAVCPFELWDVTWQQWNGWDWIRPDGKPTPQYEAIAALPKPSGEDWQPRGEAVIEGRVRDAEFGRGIPQVVVWTQPGNYAAETDTEGRYRIVDLPPGVYTISLFRDGFHAGPAERVTVTASEPFLWNAVLRRGSLLPGGFDRAGHLPGVAQGWQTVDGKPHPETFTIDDVYRRSGRASQRIAAGEGGRESRTLWTVGDYLSALPGKVYTARVWCRTARLVRGAGRGPGLTLEFADSYGVPLASAPVDDEAEGNTDWHPLIATLAAPQEARRLRVTLCVEAESGFVWFDDLFVGEADWPLPGTPLIARPTGTVRGTVRDPWGRPVAGATVSTATGHHWAVTDAQGQFLLRDVPIGTVRLRAFAPRFPPALSEPRGVAAGETTVDLVFPPPPLPRTLVDPGFENPGPEPAYLGAWRKWGTVDGIQKSGQFHFPIPAHGGQYFLGSASSFNTKNGGVYQTVAVEPGRVYEARVWIYTLRRGGRPADTACRLGMDPTGGEDPTAPTVRWTPFTESEGQWTLLSLQVQAQRPLLTVFLEHRQRQGNEWNITCFDDAELREVE